jgi:hypothetical protein
LPRQVFLKGNENLTAQAAALTVGKRLHALDYIAGKASADLGCVLFVIGKMLGFHVYSMWVGVWSEE